MGAASAAARENLRQADGQFGTEPPLEKTCVVCGKRGFHTRRMSSNGTVTDQCRSCGHVSWPSEDLR